MTPAAEIREAARLLRERAQAATPGPWHPTSDPLGNHVENGDGAGRIVFGYDDRGDRSSLANVEHIAGMDPVFALAVANWLDHVAARHSPSAETVEDALAVARAVLGTEVTDA